MGTVLSKTLKGAWACAVAVGLSLGPAARARAMEISLEENKASRGNIGYVDIHKVFRLFPETIKAKQSYQEIVRQAEEQINLRKAELLTLRADLSTIKLERELLDKTPIPIPPPRQAPVPASTETIKAATAPGGPEGPSDIAQGAAGSGTVPADLVLVSTASLTLGSSEQATLNHLPGMGPSTGTAVSPREEKPAEAALPPLPGTAAKKPAPPLVINIPGVTEKPIIVEPPTQAEPPPAVQGSTAAPASPVAQTPPAAPGAPKGPSDIAQGTAGSGASPAGPSPAEDALKVRSARLAELDEKIRAKQGEIGTKDAAFKAHQAQLEKDLIDIESRRSEMLLGKIYDAIREVARESGVSVVVDKSQILFGQNSVDLTDKVIKKLQETPS